MTRAAWSLALSCCKIRFLIYCRYGIVFMIPNLKNSIAFLHGLTGCDTIFTFFGKGKEKISVFLITIVSKIYIGRNINMSKFNSVRLECYENYRNNVDTTLRQQL